MLEVLRVDFYHVRWIWAVYVLTLVGVEVVAGTLGGNIAQLFHLQFASLVVAPLCASSICCVIHGQDFSSKTFHYLLTQPFERSKLWWLRVLFTMALLFIPVLVLMPFHQQNFQQLPNNTGVLAWMPIYIGLAPLMAILTQRHGLIWPLVFISPLGIWVVLYVLLAGLPRLPYLSGGFSFERALNVFGPLLMVLFLWISKWLWQRAEVR